MLEKKKMLVIEEELVTARMITYDLDGIPIDISVASNWIEAVRLLREEKFQLVLVDLEVADLPELTQVFDFIHGIDLDYRILPVFANELEFSEMRYFLMRAGIQLAMAKPWDKDELRKLVNIAFDE